MDLDAIKKAVHKQLLEQIEAQIDTIQKVVESVEESRNNETKSSVGDKYETGRAMMQNEIARQKTQLDFTFSESKTKEVKHIVKLKDQNNAVFYDKLLFLYLEMPNFNKSIDELDNHFDRWLYVLKNLASLKERPLALQKRIFEKVFRIAEIAKFKPKERQQYEDSLKIYRDMVNVIDTSFEEGEQIGLERGEQIGLERGKLIGLEKGAHKKAIETACKMLKKEMELELISEITGLSVEFIADLKCP